ncbi:MAG: glutamate formimidoyltransferase [Elusimicrobiaceae bacterium]|nr:glutamate formimidoyltransferase [Elusimicrobiaceae bacterium]
MQIIEAVPNISEAKNTETLTRILTDLRAALGDAKLLHIDSNPDANRTVITLAGAPADVVQACFALFKACQKHINMQEHHGAHPRLGAVDVCPLVPVQEISLEQTAQLADDLARRVAAELNLPVYLYEANAKNSERKNLAFIRRGEYESLPNKLKTLPPDYGPQDFSPCVQRSGASVMGARNFLIAFNISLNTQNVTAAKEIAAKLRAKNGGLPAVKAIGWYMESYHCAQVSFNLTDFHQSNLQDVFEACKQEATALGLQITGSELIGLIPQEALLRAGKFYAPHEVKETALMNAAVEHLLLSNIRPFVVNERVLEQRLMVK